MNKLFNKLRPLSSFIRGLQGQGNYKFAVSSYYSIFHRITGIFLFFFFVFIIMITDLYDIVGVYCHFINGFFFKCLLFSLTFFFFFFFTYHLLNGLRHSIWDFFVKG